MKKLFTSFIKTWLISLFCLFSISITSFAKSDSTIQINSEIHALVAPEGNHYQWFRYNEPLHGENGKELSITESGNYSVEIIDEVGSVSRQEVSVAVTATGAIIKIYIIGDSTVCNYKASDYPQTGWGQLLPLFFNSNISITNNAIGGRSSRSFTEEGRWTTIKDALQAGDYVFIQFGHNDRDNSNAGRYTSVPDFKTYLTTFCKDAKAKGAIPVLVSPMVMNAWTGTTMRNVFTETGNNYRGGMQEVATAQNVAFIDLNMKSWNLYKTYGSAYNQRFLYKGFVAGEYPNYPTGITDGTHFQEMGSLSHCRMITEGIKELSARADMANLISNLKPLYSIGINVNPTGSDDYTTKTSTYPQGATVTLKTLPKTTSKFQKWNNASGTQVSTATLTTVVAGASSTFYSAIYAGAVISDCNGTPNGTAKLDNCDRCVAGTTGKTACVSVGEAETDACVYDGILESSNAGFKGTSYVNVPNVVGSSISFNINAVNAGTALLSFRYANGGANDRPAQISLNNTVLANNLSFPVTGAFATWKTVELSITLIKGINTVKLSSTTSEGLSNIDQIGYVSAGLAKGSCVITGTLDIELETLNINVYPNPFTSVISIAAKGDFQYSILNVSGQVLETGTAHELTKVGEGLPAGMYVIKIQQNQALRIVSVVKK